jgi:hypothetical protein
LHFTAGPAAVNPSDLRLQPHPAKATPNPSLGKDAVLTASMTPRPGLSPQKRDGIQRAAFGVLVIIQAAGLNQQRRLAEVVPELGVQSVVAV